MFFLCAFIVVEYILKPEASLFVLRARPGQNKNQSWKVLKLEESRVGCWNLRECFC